MILFPQAFVSALIWGGLGLSLLGVVMLSVLWARDASKGKLW